MKKFTATHLNKHAQEVFAAAKEGPVMIKHDYFKKGRFIITWEKSYDGPDIIGAIGDKEYTDYDEFAKDFAAIMNRSSTCEP